jgi:hypothetical protein
MLPSQYAYQDRARQVQLPVSPPLTPEENKKPNVSNTNLGVSQPRQPLVVNTNVQQSTTEQGTSPIPVQVKSTNQGTSPIPINSINQGTSPLPVQVSTSTLPVPPSSTPISVKLGTIAPPTTPMSSSPVSSSPLASNLPPTTTNQGSYPSKSTPYGTITVLPPVDDYEQDMLRITNQVRLLMNYVGCRK